MKLLRALWQEAGAMWILMLVFIAGSLNAAGFLQYRQTLSHMTGNLTRLGLSFTGRDGEAAALLLVCLFSFFFGATLSGYGFPEHWVGLWRRSGAVLMMSGALLMLAEILPFPSSIRIAALALVLGAKRPGAALSGHPDPHNAHDGAFDGLRRGAGAHGPQPVLARGEPAPVYVSSALPVVFPLWRGDDRAFPILA